MRGEAEPDVPAVATRPTKRAKHADEVDEDDDDDADYVAEHEEDDEEEDDEGADKPAENEAAIMLAYAGAAATLQPLDNEAMFDDVDGHSCSESSDDSESDDQEDEPSPNVRAAAADGSLQTHADRLDGHALVSADSPQVATGSAAAAATSPPAAAGLQNLNDSCAAAAGDVPPRPPPPACDAQPAAPSASAREVLQPLGPGTNGGHMPYDAGSGLTSTSDLAPGDFDARAPVQALSQAGLAGPLQLAPDTRAFTSSHIVDAGHPVDLDHNAAARVRGVGAGPSGVLPDTPPALDWQRQIRGAENGLPAWASLASPAGECAGAWGLGDPQLPSPHFAGLLGPSPRKPTRNTLDLSNIEGEAFFQQCDALLAQLPMEPLEDISLDPDLEYNMFLQRIFSDAALPRPEPEGDEGDDDLEYQPVLSGVSGAHGQEADDVEPGEEYQGPALHTRRRVQEVDTRASVAASIRLPELPAAATESVVEGVYLEGPVFTDLQRRQLFCQVQAHCQQLLQTFLIGAQRTHTPAHTKLWHMSEADICEVRRGELDATALEAWELLDAWEAFSGEQEGQAQPVEHEVLGAVSIEALQNQPDAVRDALADGWRPVILGRSVPTLTAVPWLQRETVLSTLGVQIVRNDAGTALQHVSSFQGQDLSQYPWTADASASPLNSQSMLVLAGMATFLNVGLLPQMQKQLVGPNSSLRHPASDGEDRLLALCLMNYGKNYAVLEDKLPGFTADSIQIRVQNVKKRAARAEKMAASGAARSARKPSDKRTSNKALKDAMVQVLESYNGPLTQLEFDILWPVLGETEKSLRSRELWDNIVHVHCPWRTAQTLARVWTKAEELGKKAGSEVPLATGTSPPHELLQYYIYHDLLPGSAPQLWAELPQVAALEEDGLLHDHTCTARPTSQFLRVFDDHCSALTRALTARTA